MTRLIAIPFCIAILAIWGLVFMCACRVLTGQWWMTDDI